jgi:FimV-like protein
MEYKRTIKKGSGAFFLCLLLPLHPYALELGPATIDSALNEPLKVSIPLSDYKAANQDHAPKSLGDLLYEAWDPNHTHVTAHLANESEFDKVGIVFDPALRDLEFHIVEKGENQAFLEITSKTPILSEFINVLISVEWPSGRKITEYVLLLQPPALDTSASIETSQTRPIPLEQTILREKPLTPGKTNDYTTHSGDTLWKIAAKYKQGPAHTQQWMIAIYEKNTKAFKSNNINLLKSNQQLTLPSQEEASKITLTHAKARILQDEPQAQTTVAGTPQATPPQPIETATQPETVVQKPSQALKVLTKTAPLPTLSTQTNTPIAPMIPATQADAPQPSTMDKTKSLLTQETLITEQKKQADLQDQIQSVKTQLADTQKLLDLQTSDSSRTNTYSFWTWIASALGALILLRLIYRHQKKRRFTQDADWRSPDTPQSEADLPPDQDMVVRVKSSDTRTNMNLAKTYIELGDIQRGQMVLEKILNHGTPSEQAEARELLKNTN